MSSIQAQDHSTGLLRQFQALATRFSSLVAEEGLRTLPYLSETLPLFSKLTTVEQKGSLEDLSGVLTVFDELRAGGQKLVDTPQLLWRSLKRLNFLCESDVFEKIVSGDVVQIFTAEQKLVFWNLMLLDMVSFTVEQLFCSPWWLLGQRTPDVSAQIYQAAYECATGARPGTFDPKIPEHLFKETETTENQSFNIRIKYLSPLKRDGRIAGFMVINGANRVL